MYNTNTLAMIFFILEMLWNMNFTIGMHFNIFYNRNEFNNWKFKIEFQLMNLSVDKVTHLLSYIITMNMSKTWETFLIET